MENLEDFIKRCYKKYSGEYADNAFYNKNHKYFRNESGRRRETGFKESALYYSVIRKLKPNIIWDVGSGDGGSTYPMALATKMNKVGHIYSFECFNERCINANANLKRIGLRNQVTIIDGLLHNDIDDISKYTEANTFEKYKHLKPNVLFIDADHGEKFAEWYMDKLFALNPKLISIHDIHYGDHPIRDESIVIREFIEKTMEYESFANKDFLGRVSDDPSGVGSANSGIWLRKRQMVET